MTKPFGLLETRVFTACFGVIIFLFLGYVDDFSTKQQPCNYDNAKMCKPALVNALFSTLAFMLGVVTYVLSGYFGMKIATYAKLLMQIPLWKPGSSVYERPLLQHLGLGL